MSYVAQQADVGAVSLLDFDQKSGSLIERALFNNRLVIVLLCLVATAALGFQATRLSLNAAFEKMIPTRHEYIANFLENQALRSMAGLGTIVVACGLVATFFGFLYGSFFGLEDVLPALWIRPMENITQILSSKPDLSLETIALAILRTSNRARQARSARHNCAAFTY